MVRNNSQEKLEPYNFLVRITSNKIITNKINAYKDEFYSRNRDAK